MSHAFVGLWAGVEAIRGCDVSGVGGREEGVMEFEGGGEEVVVPEGGRGRLTDEETAVAVVEKGGWCAIGSVI